MALEGVRCLRQAPAALYPQKDEVPIVQKAGWAPGPVWTGAENLAPTGIHSAYRPARSAATLTTVPGPQKYCTAVIIIQTTIRRRCVDVAGTIDGGV
jgi:hypothetical protein